MSWSLLTQHLEPAPSGTPSQVHGHRSRLPVLGGARQNAFSGVDSGPLYRPSPVQQFGDFGPRNSNRFEFGGEGSKRVSSEPINSLLGR